jgi:hypothetical protein
MLRFYKGLVQIRSGFNLYGGVRPKFFMSLNLGFTHCKANAKSFVNLKIHVDQETEVDGSYA